ncbi:MAG TPA: hypothetical protein VIU11_14870 [Nakamurella sp.]
MVVVDTCATERRTRAVRTAVNRACADAPITMAVDTHLHGDHTYGNSLLPAPTEHTDPGGQARRYRRDLRRRAA